MTWALPFLAWGFVIGVCLTTTCLALRAGRRDASRLEALADLTREPPPAPGRLLSNATAELRSIWTCGCTITYLHDGGTLFVSCGQHRRHPDWQAWETEFTTEGQA